VCLGNEPVRLGDGRVGRITSGGYGHRVDKSIAYAYVPRDIAVGGRVEVGVFGRWVEAEVAREPLYDPDNERVKRAPVLQSA
jgi:4-methylaminobutanoate oxidase (formaldehyde-forming)